MIHLVGILAAVGYEQTINLSSRMHCSLRRNKLGNRARSGDLQMRRASSIATCTGGGGLGADGGVGGDAAALGEAQPLLGRDAERLQRGLVEEHGAHARRLVGRGLLERGAAGRRRRGRGVEVRRARHQLRRARRHAGARRRPGALRVGGRRGGRRRAGDGEGDGQEALHCAALCCAGVRAERECVAAASDGVSDR